MIVTEISRYLEKEREKLSIEYVNEHIQLKDGNEIEDYFKSAIFSSSGIRKVFSADRRDDSISNIITINDFILTYSAVASFVNYLERNKLLKGRAVAVAKDTRPTGEVLSWIVIHVLMKKNIKPIYTGVGCGPETMAFAACNPLIDAFFYLTASHNPPGHNGFKFGGKAGVFGGETVNEIIAEIKKKFREYYENKDSLLSDFANNIRDLDHVFDNAPFYKICSFDEYQLFLEKVFWGKNSENRCVFTLENKKSPLGIIGEYNGSSRILSFDGVVLEKLGFHFSGENNELGVFQHAIVPEGKSLEPAAEYLRTYNQKSGQDKYHFAYVPDCDGDRGNIVLWDEEKKETRILEAQTVFALSVIAEVGYAFLTGDMTEEAKNAVVVNDCTSCRIEELLRKLPVQVFRTETGEANVVSKARELEKEGWKVRIIGEGSNGGNITRPSNTRDPLSSLIAFAKLLKFKHEGRDIFSLFSPAKKNNPAIGDYLELIPVFQTTSAFDEGAILKIKSEDQRELKIRFEEVFLDYWKNREEEFSSLGIENYEELNYEGTREIKGFGPEFRSSDASGGLKIIFKGRENEMKGWMFFRKSKTENLVRTIVDVYSDEKEDEVKLRSLLREMIKRADKRD